MISSSSQSCEDSGYVFLTLARQQSADKYQQSPVHSGYFFWEMSSVCYWYVERISSSEIELEVSTRGPRYPLGSVYSQSVNGSLNCQ